VQVYRVRKLHFRKISAKILPKKKGQHHCGDLVLGRAVLLFVKSSKIIILYVCKQAILLINIASHVWPLDCWRKEININPTSPGYEKSCNTVQQKWEYRRLSSPNSHSHPHTQALVSPIKSFSNLLYATKPSWKRLNPPAMLLIWRWICFYPCRQTQVGFTQTTHNSQHQFTATYFRQRHNDQRKC